MKKVLIITYYWPPSGGGGVQRWLKFAKYLPEFGWEPIIFTPENPDFEFMDESLVEEQSANLEIIKLPIWEPYSAFRYFTSDSTKSSVKQGMVLENRRSTWKEKLAVWVRGNLILPDPKIFWKRNSVKLLETIIKDHQVDLIITTGPPHSLHLIGKSLSHKTGVKWIADFRDPWSDWDLLKQLRSGTLAMALHRKWENSVVKKADLVLTTAPGLAKKLGHVLGSNVRCITNGFDHEDFDKDKSKIEKFRITHIGLLNAIRNPERLWEVLNKLIESVEGFAKDFELFLAGIISPIVVEQLERYPALREKLIMMDFLAHDKVVKEYSKSSVLLLLMNRSANIKYLIPGKLFEYLGAQRKVLAIGERASDVETILDATGAGNIVDFEDAAGIEAFIMEAYRSHKNGQATVTKNVMAYSRKALTKDLVDEMNHL